MSGRIADRRGRGRKDGRGRKYGASADNDSNWRSAPSQSRPLNPAPVKEDDLPQPDSEFGRHLLRLHHRLRSGVEMETAFSECREALTRCVECPDSASQQWNIVLLECIAISPRRESLFQSMIAFFTSVQSACRLRLQTRVFSEFLDHLLRAPEPHRQPIVGALAALILGNITEVPSRISRLMQVFETSLGLGDDPGDETAKLTALQGMANICYIEEGSQITPSSDFLRATWLPRLISHFLQHMEISYAHLVSAETSETPQRLYSLLVMKACLVGLSFLLCRQPKLDLNIVRAAMTHLRPLCGLGLTRLGPLVQLHPSTTAQGSETATGRSPGTPLFATGKTKTSGGRRQVEFKHGPEALETRIRHLKISGDAEIDALLACEPDSSESEIENEDDERKERGIRSSPERSLMNKLRHLSLTCLRRLLAISLRKVVHSVWLDFLPPGPSLSWPGRPADLLTLLLKESLAKNRILLLDTVQLFFDGSRQYLSAAEDVCEPSMAFTPYSLRLAASVREIHRRLVVALLAEREVGVQVHLLKCLALLVTGVPYHKLKPGLITRVFRLARTYLDRSEASADLRTGCLSLIGAILACDGPLFEVCHGLAQPPLYFTSGDASQLSGLQTPSSGALFDDCNFGSCWLVTQCLQLAHPDLVGWGEGRGVRHSAPVRVQALATLRQMLSHYVRFLRPSMDAVKRTLKLCLEEGGDNDQMMLRTQAIKLLASLLPVMKEEEEEEWERLWKEFINPLVLALQCESHYSVRSWAAQCLALADDAVFSRVIDRRTLLACLTIMLGRAGGPDVEPDGHVRGNAIRALGHWISVPALLWDAGFVSDVVHRAMALSLAAEDAHLVRSHAAWCLANAVEVLVAHRERGEEEEESMAVLREFGEQRYADLLRCAVALCTGTVKHRENGARTLGYLFRLVPGRMFHDCPEVGEVMRNGAAVLADCMRLHESNGAAKIRWNACYAAGNLFRNEELPLGTGWTESIFLALRDALLADKYFKVRNYACLSLLLVHRRDRFDHGVFVPLTEAVVTTLVEGKDEWVAFTEAHHRSYLLYLLCLLAIRLLSLARSQDLPSLASHLALDAGLWTALPQVWNHLTSFQAQFSKDSLIPRWVISYNVVHATAEEVHSALHQLRVHLFGLVGMPDSQPFVSSLCDLCDKVAGAEKEKETSAFRQTYD